MKTCCDCNVTKPLEEFTVKTSCKDGYEPRCKKCRSIKYNKSTPEIVLRKMYLSQITNSIRRGHPLPAYSPDEFIAWGISQPSFSKLWAEYVQANYLKDLRPSADRLDDAKPYSFDNIQLLTWAQNRTKGALSKKEGTVNARQKAVAAYNLDGTLHRKYISISEAVRDVQGKAWGISTVADGVPVRDGRGTLYNPKTYKGYVWKWIELPR